MKNKKSENIMFKNHPLYKTLTEDQRFILDLIERHGPLTMEELIELYKQAKPSPEAYPSIKSVKSQDTINTFENQEKKADSGTQKNISNILEKNYTDDFALSIHQAVRNLIDVKKISETTTSEDKILINVI